MAGDGRVAELPTTTTTSKKFRCPRPATTSSSRPAAWSPQPRRQARDPTRSTAAPRAYFDNDALQSSNVPDELAGRRRHGRTRPITTSRSATTATTSAGRSGRTTRGSTTRTRIIWTCSWCATRGRARGRDEAEKPRREGELAGDEERPRQLPLLRWLQDQGQPQPRHDRHSVRRADRHLSPGQRVQRQSVPRPVEAGRRPRLLDRTCSTLGKLRVLQHRLRAEIRKADSTCRRAAVSRRRSRTDRFSRA